MQQQFKPEAPQQIVEAFRQGLDNFVRNNASYRERLKNAGPTGLPIFTLTLDDVAQGKLNANPVGWRLLFGGSATEDTVEPTLADVATTGRHTAPQVVGFSQNEQVTEFFQHFEKILQMEQLIVAGMGFNLALLRIPGLTVDAFWLRSRAGGADIVVPIRGPANLELRQYSLDEFLRALRPLAGKFLAFNNEII